MEYIIKCFRNNGATVFFKDIPSLEKAEELIVEFKEKDKESGVEWQYKIFVEI